MNSPFVVEQARALAARPEVAAAGNSADKVQTLYRLIYARAADPDEAAVGTRFLETPPEAQPPLYTVWQYGFGEYDEAAKQVHAFTAFTHFQDGMWRGGPALPDPNIGCLMLTAEGGHPGGDLKHVVVRRWKAPAGGIASIVATLDHPAEPGDGVRARVVSSRSGELGSWSVHHGNVETRVERIDVAAGETIDFVVDCLTNEAHDSFSWPVAVELNVVEEGKQSTRRFEAAKDFRGPAPTRTRLSPLEQYAQALLMANEFLFID
jgi:hypothetical protein